MLFLLPIKHSITIVQIALSIYRIKARIGGEIPHSATMIKFPALKFWVLGLFYLLPFNTFLNSYNFYQRILHLSYSLLSIKEIISGRFSQYF